MPDHATAADELAATLRRLRTDAAVSGVELGARIGSSQATVSRYESGRLVPSPLVAGRLGWALRAPRPVRRRLIELAGAAAEERAEIVPTRVLLQQGVAQLQRRIRHRERSALHVATFQPALVPGLLQTERYMRAVVAGPPASTPQEDAAWIRERLARQLQMVQPGRSAVQIVAESALHWGAAGPDVMIEQCEHLATLAIDRPGWRVGVVPRRLPPDTPPLFPTNGFTIHDGRTVLLGTTAGNAIVTDEHVVRDHRELFAGIEQVTLFGAAASDVFRQVAERYRAEP